jgi:CBS domain-containing membrane protein
VSELPQGSPNGLKATQEDHMGEELTVADLMTADPARVLADDDLTQVYELMNDRAIRHVPVVDEDGALEGIISHRDLVRSALFAMGELPYSEQQRLLKAMRVREIMTTDPATVEPDTELAEAARLLLENKFGCLPVVEGESLVGILTEADFVKYMLSERFRTSAVRFEGREL